MSDNSAVLNKVQLFMRELGKPILPNQRCVELAQACQNELLFAILTELQALRAEVKANANRT